jgi:hypothetical protein
VEDQSTPIPEEVTSKLGRIIDMHSEGQSYYLPSNNGEKEIEEGSVDVRVATRPGHTRKAECAQFLTAGVSARMEDLR